MSKVVILLPKAKSVCGIYDYAINVYNEIKNKEADIININIDNSIYQWFKLFTSVSNSSLIMQYPALAYRSSILPILYALLSKLRRIKLISVIHENSEVSMSRRTLNRAITLLSNRVIVTNKVEYNSLSFRVQKKTSIIPIGANTLGIAPNPDQKPLNNRVVFFGLIRKDKGIEEFIELIDSDKSSKFKYVFVAGTTNLDQSYTEDVLKKLEARNVELHLNKNLTTVHNLLCCCTYSFLVYPDGASERRGSLLAAFKAGCIVFSNNGRQTPNLIQKVIIAPSYVALSEIHDSSDENKRAHITRSISTSQCYAWDKIASEIMKVVTSENITIR